MTTVSNFDFGACAKRRREDNQRWIVIVAAAGWLAMAVIAGLLVTGTWSPAADSAPSPDQHVDRPNDEPAVTRLDDVDEPGRPTADTTVVPRPRRTPLPAAPRVPRPRAGQVAAVDRHPTRTTAVVALIPKQAARRQF